MLVVGFWGFVIYDEMECIFRFAGLRAILPAEERKGSMHEPE